LQEQPPLRRLAVLGLDRQALLDVVAGDDLVEEAARLPCVARHIGQAALVLVELLQRRDRQEEVVLVEAEQARRIVHQDVGVQHEQLFQLGFSGTARLLCTHDGVHLCGGLFNIIGL